MPHKTTVARNIIQKIDPQLQTPHPRTHRAASPVAPLVSECSCPSHLGLDTVEGQWGWDAASAWAWASLLAPAPPDSGCHLHPLWPDTSPRHWPLAHGADNFQDRPLPGDGWRVGERRLGGELGLETPLPAGWLQLLPWFLLIFLPKSYQALNLFVRNRGLTWSPLASLPLTRAHRARLSCLCFLASSVRGAPQGRACLSGGCRAPAVGPPGGA